MDIDENIEDYANTIDVTPFFWNLIRDIVSMDYETLKQTQSFQRLVYCVNEYDFKYSLSNSVLIDGTLHFIDILS